MRATQKPLRDRMKARILKMTLEQRTDLAQNLREKADSVLNGDFEAESFKGENCLWAGDLLRAAGIITGLKDKKNVILHSVPLCCTLEGLTQGEAEEIESILD